MSTRTVADAKAHLPEMLDGVLTGRAVAKLVRIVENAPPLGWAALDARLAAGASEAPGMTVEKMRARALL